MRRHADGGEVLSTLADAHAGGDRIGAALVQALTGAGLDDLPAERRWPMLANIRAARHALSEQVAGDHADARRATTDGGQHPAGDRGRPAGVGAGSASWPRRRSKTPTSPSSSSAAYT